MSRVDPIAKIFALAGAAPAWGLTVLGVVIGGGAVNMAIGAGIWAVFWTIAAVWSGVALRETRD